MDPRTLLEFLHVLEKLKCNTRHSWTSDGTHETVAAHSWRLATLALLLREEIPGIDFDKVITMCLLHDIGEAVTGDIPSFEKSADHETNEARAVTSLLAMLPTEKAAEFDALFAEMNALQTAEARLYKALDKLEAVMQHNESPLSTWLPLEYKLQTTYGVQEAEAFPYLKALRAEILLDTERKITSEQ